MISHIDKFRTKLDAGYLCLGTGLTFSDPAVTEALCQSVDFIWFDLEHNPTSLESLLAHLIAARAGGAPAIVRVPSNDIAWTKRVLDTGAEGIMLPRVASAQEAQQFVSACRYPPMGTRGFGPRRPTNYGRIDLDEFFQQANYHLFVSVQIETMRAVEEIDQILSIEGLDSVMIGPNDLSGAMGILGQVDDPQLLETISTVFKKTKDAGLYAGIGKDANTDYLIRAAELGAQWIQCGCDFEYLIRSADRLFTDIRDGVGSR